ncbi:histidine kinase dimerization/phospho-acceptor domain-containing protein [Polyangium sp. y55x31]|uniref:sensor histidine kinase n=1 Tax=Polyangium sp. y55x31 TaxID=3042688 RepID=UPI002482A230|nr:histidine kinase dimerization/phospho-acceptor domain-containing protein [Polyangium sp. y55x31]MDI1483781.1 histidine kinase dimerization/phospho-acceptor domain-containing protein [Polyangium sp. y55x31]
MEELLLAADGAPSSSRFAALVAGLGHDLRAPLHAILGATGLLIEEVGEGAGHETWLVDLKAIDTSGRQLVDLLELLIELARVESGKAPITHTVGTIESVVEPLLSALQSRGARIELRREGTPAPVLADMRRAKVALGVLLRMVMARSAEPSVTIAVTHAAEDVSISVVVGPDCAAAWGLAGDASFTDAGLSLVRALLAHAGSAWSVEHAPDGGATIALTVPRPRGSPADVREEEKHGTHPGRR